MTNKYPNLEEAFAILHNEQLYYFNILSSMTLKVLESFPYAGAVLFNPKTQTCELIISANSARLMSPTHLKVLLEHECEHISRRHLQISLEHIEDLKNEENRRIANIAQDYLINDSIQFWGGNSRTERNYDAILAKREQLSSEINALEEEGTEEGKKRAAELTAQNALYFGCLWPDIENFEELNGRKSKDISFIELYHILKKNSDKLKEDQDSMDQHQPDDNGDEEQDGQGSGDSQEEGDSQPGESSEGKGGNSKTKLKEIPQYVADALIKKAAEKTMEMTKGMGSISDSARMRLEEIDKQKLNLKSELNIFNNSIVSTQRSRTWSKVNRRYPNMTKGSKKTTITRLVIWNDTSGSQWSVDTQQKVANAVKHLAKLNGDVEVVVGDTELKSVIKINDGRFNLSKFVIEGGGGTSPQFVYDYAKKNKADGVVLITDGYVQEFSTFGIKSLVLLVGDQVTEIKNIKNIHLK